MLLHRSIRAQLLALIGASLLSMLIFALGSFHFLSGNITAYQGLLDGPLEASRLVDEANLKFKVQVQEWKNVLLRGGSPGDREKYWESFKDQESQVQVILERLVVLSQGNTALTTQIRQLQAEHRTLGASYRRGLEAFVTLNPRRTDWIQSIAIYRTIVYDTPEAPLPSPAKLLSVSLSALC